MYLYTQPTTQIPENEIQFEDEDEMEIEENVETEHTQGISMLLPFLSRAHERVHELAAYVEEQARNGSTSPTQEELDAEFDNMMTSMVQSVKNLYLNHKKDTS